MTIWKMSIDLETVNKRGKNTMAEYLGIVFTEIGDDFLKATMPVDHRTKQPLGIMNGGASCVLAETIASTAANYCVNQSERYCVGLDINANHIRPAAEGFVTAITNPIHLGNTTQVWQIDIFNESNKRVCVARMTAAVVTRK